MNQTHVDAEEDGDFQDEKVLRWPGVVVSTLCIFGILVAVVAL
jgi:hypothetical protein